MRLFPLLTSLSYLLLSLVPATAQKVVPHGVPGNWQLVNAFSDEFNGPKIDTQKWETHTRPWGERSWDPDNLVQKNGKLFITARYEPHTLGGTEYFYKLGILQSHKKTTYGYFEARIKGCSRFPGLCPAFWLYSNGRERNPDYPRVTYSEVDIVEMLQGLYHPELHKFTGPNFIDCNLHTRILDENGKEIWQRPNSLPELCRNHYIAPWDPRDDFHIYGAEISPEKIVWYIDGKKVAESENRYWHLPMTLALTMELRPPFIDWAGEATRVPVPEATTPDGFPTTMTIDYVRSWVRKP
ncbi:kappa-carrageenase [Roseibacillus persicicus]|uniref:kappa-carrageenase n=1 Tax=Roseibacillus persicicus TaxID=454148 RepID=UPI00280C5761|nr:kappa-carrageenase [Roseibacillus persicicus]MDQ8190349.1 kappa-carrageenase [Roseibacillus persicicus]